MVIAVPFASRFSLAAEGEATRHKLIDVHAHVFNATDLPARRFLKIVFLHKHPEQGIERLLSLDNADLMDWLIELFIRITSGRAPTAKAEIAVLTGTAPLANAAKDLAAADEITIERVSQFLREPNSPTLSRDTRSASGAAALKRAVMRAGGAAPSSRLSPTADDAKVLAANAYRSNTDVGTYLRWFNFFSMYRSALADHLVESHRKQGYEPILIAPALIDYSKWLGQEVTSPIVDQVEVMGAIARRPNGPAVHGYVCFDPLREILHRRGLEQGRSPIEVVRSAITEHGFLGVKLYPPMGFKPAGNARGQQYPQEIIERLEHRVSKDLNRVLDDLFSLCSELSAPVIAHAAESNAAGPGYARRADPAHWLPVLQKHPGLRLGLAHFGRFSYVSSAAPPGSKLPESSWEWTLGRYIAANPTRPVFFDLSYFSEVLAQDDATKRRELSRTLRKYIELFDPDVRHLMFGTDWVMLGVESGSDEYTAAVAKFLRDDCGVPPDVMRRVFYANAREFLGSARAQRREIASAYSTDRTSSVRTVSTRLTKADRSGSRRSVSALLLKRITLRPSLCCWRRRCASSAPLLDDRC